MSSQAARGYQQSVDDFAHRHRHPDEAFYLLLAPFAGCPGGHPLDIARLAEALGSDAVTRIDSSGLVQAPERWPALVRLARPGQACGALAALSATYAAREATATWHYVCAWLLSDQPADAIARHISQQCHVLHQPAPHGITAWYEPVRLALLRVTLNNAGAVLGPIRSWLHPDGCGSCTVLERPSPAGELRITREVRATQSVAPQIIQLLSAWHRLATAQTGATRGQCPGSSGLPANAPVHVMNLMIRAFKQGLRDRGDIQCMCLHLLMVHPLLLEHPTIQRDVARAVAGQQRLAACFARYGDRAWARIVADLPQAGGYS